MTGTLRTHGTPESPDRWVVLKLTDGDVTSSKLLMGWFGGYIGSNSWKLNSGIVSVEETKNSFIFTGKSGKVYECFKLEYGFTNMTYSVYGGLVAKFGDAAVVIDDETYKGPCEAYREFARTKLYDALK